MLGGISMKHKKIDKFQILANSVMIVVTLAAILPFILLFMSSITDESVLLNNGYGFWPEVFSLEAYAYIFKSGEKILRAYGMTILVTVIGTTVHLTLSALFAYPLAVKGLPGRRAITFFVFFTMLFNGGLVPSYMMWTSIFHIKDTIFGLIVPTFLMGP